ncbi:3-oxoacyl-ACP synthase III [Candidatus Viridilinea mediisalina]|uniref:3-oxoacyl-ACP synthase III n=1 Tax=Candidatus Viridilinea mediisalina TaxID=2024553 RepID=A0A2A6RLH1_9CHLR|nr:3-oxoacyl-ACP synthase III [Candidatus Viridilinea mediisalina]PDW03917.1 3-oxoacyl-ACP synthase III [Candidatus Viridilinea mediisalina]
MLFQNVAIEALSYELAPHRISSDWLEDQMGSVMQRMRMPKGRLEQLSGIQERRFWAPGTRPSDAATLAARKLLASTDVDPAQIGIVINTSVCQDFLEPSTACFVHRNLGLSPHAINYDLRNACLGFLNGMYIAAMMIESGAITHALIVNAEGSQDIVMETIKWLQRPETTDQEFRDSFATLTLGSGAAAMLLTHASLTKQSHRLNGVVSLAATEHNNLCFGNPTYMKTDASALLSAGVKLARATWALAHERLPNWSDEAITLYAPHQVSARHMTSLADALGLTYSKLYLNFQVLGNIGPAALPISLAQAAEAGRLQPGDQIGLLGIGSGLNCSMMSVTW